MSSEPPVESEPSAIRENIEDTRCELRADVDALTARVDPAMAVRRGGRRIGDLMRTAREQVMGTAGDTVERMSDGVAGRVDLGRIPRGRHQGRGQKCARAGPGPPTRRRHGRVRGRTAGGHAVAAQRAGTPPRRRAGELAAGQVAPLAEQAGDLTAGPGQQ
jgi:hypothetical protein